MFTGAEDELVEYSNKWLSWYADKLEKLENNW